MSGTGKEKAEKAGNKVAAAPEKRPDGAEAMAAANFDVEQLVALRHDRKGRVEFLVRWKTYDASHDTWEPLENLEGTANMAIEEYYSTHPQTRGFDCLEGESRKEHDLTNEFSSAVTSFYKAPSLTAYVAVSDSRPDTLSQRQLYDDAFRWLREAAVVAVAEAGRSFQSDSSQPSVRDADLMYFRVMIDLCTSEAVQGSSEPNVPGLLFLLQKILPLRLSWAARNHQYELTVLIERIVEALMVTEPSVAASTARTQLLSLAGHIGRQARRAWAEVPEMTTRIEACTKVDEEGEELLAGLRGLAEEESFVGAASPKQRKQRNKPGPKPGPKKRKLEPTLSERTTVDGETGGNGDDDGAGAAKKKPKVDPEHSAAAASNGDGAAPMDVAVKAEGAQSSSAAAAATDANESGIDDEESSSEPTSEEDIAPRLTRGRAGGQQGEPNGAAGDDDDNSDGDEEVERKVNTPAEFVGQREIYYTWRPLDAPLDAVGYTTTSVRVSTHTPVNKTLLAITDLLMLVTRKDRLFANKKMVTFKVWLEAQGVPVVYYGFRPRGWTGNDETVLGQEYRGKITPCLAYDDIRLVLRWLCGTKGRSGDLVETWKEAGGRQWLQAEVEVEGGATGTGQSGDAVVMALRARFHREKELADQAHETKEQERMLEAVPRWYSLLCKAAPVAAAAASAGDTAASEEEGVEDNTGWPDARRPPLWLREKHGRAVPNLITVDDTLTELAGALRRAGGFPIYRTVLLGAEPVGTVVSEDTSLAAAASEKEIAELPAAAQGLARLVVLVGSDSAAAKGGGKAAKGNGRSRGGGGAGSGAATAVKKLRDWLDTSSSS